MSTFAMASAKNAPIATPETLKQRDAALEACSIVFRVTTPAERDNAIAAGAEAKAYDEKIESARIEFKQPILDLGRAIDDLAKALREPVRAELMRISKLIGDYEALQQQKLRAEEALRQENLAKLERERQEALSKAASHDEVDKVQEKFNQAAASLPAPEPPSKAKGQIVRQDYEIEVINAHEAYRHHPNLFKLELIMSEAKALAASGAKLHGIKATPVIKAHVKAAKEKPTLELTHS